MRMLTLCGMFALPSWGGNRDEAGWKLLGFEDRHAWQPASSRAVIHISQSSPPITATVSAISCSLAGLIVTSLTVPRSVSTVFAV